MDEKDVVEVADVEVKEKPQEALEKGGKKKKVETIVIATIMSLLVLCLITSACWYFGREEKTLIQSIMGPEGYSTDYLKVYLKDEYRWSDINEEDLNWDDIISTVTYYCSDYIIVEVKELTLRKWVATIARLDELYFVEKVASSTYSPHIPEGGIFG